MDFRFVFLLLTLCIFSCSQAPSEDELERFTASSSPKVFGMFVEADSSYSPEGRHKYMAYSHDLRVEYEQSVLEQTYQELQVFCRESEYECTVTQAYINTDNRARANLEMRIKPEGVNELLGKASSNGKVLSSSTDAEDLQDAIVDNEKRLTQLRQYEARLQALEENASTNIDSLIKIASEISRTQSQIEFAVGEKANLTRRIELDIVSIRLSTPYYSSFWAPINNAFGSFGQNLSEGAASAITFSAQVIPWLVLIVFLVLILRKLWSLRRSK